MSKGHPTFGPGFAPAEFAPPAVSVERRRDGSVILRSPEPLREYPTNLGCLLLQWAATTPERVFLAEGKLWSARVGISYRALAIEDDEGYIWVWIGLHDEYERLIQQSG